MDVLGLVGDHFTIEHGHVLSVSVITFAFETTSIFSH